MSTPPQPKEPTAIDVHSLHRYFMWANQMRADFEKILPTTDDAITASHHLPYMPYWYGGLYVVIEGWKELGLHDAEIDKLLESPNVELLKRYRNGAFHFQKNYFDDRFMDLIYAMPARWTKDLNRAFARFFLDYFKPHIQ